MPVLVLGLEGQNYPHRAGGFKGESFCYLHKGLARAWERTSWNLNLPEDQEQDLAEMLGAVVITAWEKSWATLNYPEGELFPCFFHR